MRGPPDSSGERAVCRGDGMLRALGATASGRRTTPPEQPEPGTQGKRPAARAGASEDHAGTLARRRSIRDAFSAAGVETAAGPDHPPHAGFARDAVYRPGI